MRSGGYFIVFEGIDGSGKSTQCAMTAHSLESLGVKCARLREPTEGKWGRRIREILSGRVVDATPEEQVRLFMLDRADDAEDNINPALEKGLTVIMDRYYYSNAAYQGALGIDCHEIIRENLKMNFPAPDRVYFIDLDPALAVERISNRAGGSLEIFERAPFLERVRENFLSFKDEGFIVIDGSLSPHEINRAVLDDLLKIMNLHGVVK